jgi:hypothetical protein
VNKPEYKFCDDGKVILKNPEMLSQRYRDATPPAQPAPVQEPVAWRFTGIDGFKRFVTDAQYKAFSPEVRAWYEPFKCASCTTPPAQPAPVQEPVEIDADMRNVLHGALKRSGKIIPPPAAPVQEPVAMRMPKVGDKVVCIEDESIGTIVYLTAGGSPEIKFDDGSHGTYMLREFAELFGYTTPPAAQRQWVEVEQIKWDGDKLIAKLKENT